MMIDDEEDQGKKAHLPRQLTAKEWARVKPPFVHFRPEMTTWGSIEYDIAQKFIAARGEGWWYFHDKRFIFELESDAILFKMWAKDEPLSSGMTSL